MVNKSKTYAKNPIINRYIIWIKIKLERKAYYLKNRSKILARQKRVYQNNRETLKKKCLDNYYKNKDDPKKKKKIDKIDGVARKEYMDNYYQEHKQKIKIQNAERHRKKQKVIIYNREVARLSKIFL